jgi:hypothetical protein
MVPVDIRTCTINQYLSCMFDAEYSVLGEGADADTWNSIYLDFIDMSGMAATEEYSLIVTIHNLENRETMLRQLVAITAEAIGITGQVPPNPAARLAHYGHRLPSDPQVALHTLSGIERKERRYAHDLRAARRRLDALRGTQSTDNADTKGARRREIQRINALGTIYRIDRDKTTLEEYALMIREQEEIRQQEQLRKQFSRK